MKAKPSDANTNPNDNGMLFAKNWRLFNFTFRISLRILFCRYEIVWFAMLQETAAVQHIFVAFPTPDSLCQAAQQQQ